MRLSPFSFAVFACMLALAPHVSAEDKVVDIPTRPGVAQRFSLITPAGAKAAVILFAGGPGVLDLDDTGNPRRGRNNFLIRSARLFAAQGLQVALIDTPSDRQAPPHLSGFRDTAEHAADVKAVIAWLRESSKLPVWLIGTSRGTQSVGATAIALGSAGGPDGIVLTSTVVNDPRTPSVPDMAVDRLRIPVLVVHHEQDGCRFCLFRDVPHLMDKLSRAPRKELVTFRGGESVGDPCEALAYHGYNGLEKDVVARIADWITSK
jgi:pimeloyl-ACP methyl ester carboxylesterase